MPAIRYGQQQEADPSTSLRDDKQRDRQQILIEELKSEIEKIKSKLSVGEN